MESEQIEGIETSKSWLQRLKDESWEAEVLISTVAIFGTVQLFKLISWMVVLFIDILTPSQYYIGYAVSFTGLLAVSMLTTMFVIHFLMRAYWVGLVGLNSVFPDYSLEDSAYSEIYTQRMLGVLPKLKDTIPKVDDLCSVIFSAAFFIFFMYGYFSTITFLLLLFFVNFGEMIPAPVWSFLKWMLIIIGIGQIVFSILANLKYFKKITWFQEAYFQFVKWSSMILMGPLYKFMLQISMSFATNFKKHKWLSIASIIFFVVGMVITVTQFTQSLMPHLINSEYYINDSRVYNHAYKSHYNKEDYLLGPQIDSDIIDKEVTKVFIPVYTYENKLVKKLHGSYVKDESLSDDENRIQKRAFFIERYKKYHEVSIDGEKVDLSYKQYSIPTTEQIGIIAYIDMIGLNRGPHEIKIRKKLEKESRDWVIPFQYINE